MSKIREILNKFNINGHDEIGGTDKDSCHSYVEIYEQLLEPILEKDGSLLEIGIQYGGSILLWKELLKNCRIIITLVLFISLCLSLCLSLFVSLSLSLPLDVTR